MSKLGLVVVLFNGRPIPGPTVYMQERNNPISLTQDMYIVRPRLIFRLAAFSRTPVALHSLAVGFICLPSGRVHLSESIEDGLRLLVFAIIRHLQPITVHKFLHATVGLGKRIIRLGPG